MTSGCTAMVRAMHSRCCWPPDRARALSLSLSLTSSHSAAPVSGFLDDLVQTLLHAVHARPVRDVVVDRLRERVGLLEDHADPPAHLDRVDVVGVQVLVVESDLPGDPGSGDQVVHPVEAAQDRALAAARRADQRRDLSAPDGQGDVPDGLVVAVEDAHVAHLEDRADVRADLAAAGGGLGGHEGGLLACGGRTGDAWSRRGHGPFGRRCHGHQRLWNLLRRKIAMEFIASRITSRTTIAADASGTNSSRDCLMKS